MNRNLLILGIVFIVLGVAVYAVASYTDLLGGRMHHIIPLGGLGAAVLGALIIVGGVMMGKPGATAGGEFKCAQCGAVFGSQSALDQHSKAKHPDATAKS
jgi:C2H2-type zinc finger